MLGLLTLVSDEELEARAVERPYRNKVRVSLTINKINTVGLPTFERLQPFIFGFLHLICDLGDEEAL